MRKMVLEYNVTRHLSDGSYDDYDQMFSEDLADYMDADTEEWTGVVSIVPEMEINLDGRILRMVVTYVANPNVSPTDQIHAIEEYVSGQISDGWGENGCTLGEYFYTFDWEHPRMYDREMTKEETEEAMMVIDQKIKKQEELKRSFDEELRHLLGFAQKMGI